MLKMRIAFLFVCSVLLSTTTAFPQEQKETINSDISSLERFLSKTGEMVLVTDYKLPDINMGLSGVLEAKVRKATIATETKYYYSLQKERQFSSMNWFVEYADLLEMMKAVTVLKSSFLADVNEKAFYKENRFMTKDKFRVGYFIEDNKAQWFITADRSINTSLYKVAGLVLIKDISLLEKSLSEGKQRIEELMSQK